MALIKNRTYLIIILCFVLLFTSACSKNSNHTSSNGDYSEQNNDSTLYIAGNEIALAVDPTVYPAADYLLNMGAGELLFKADAKGVIQPSLAQSSEQLDDYTWLIKLRPNVQFWSGSPVNAEAVIASLMHSKELDMKANPYLSDIEFTAIDEHTIQAVSQSPNLNIPMNLSYFQLIIHNTAAPFTYESVETADYTGMYKIVNFEPAQRMTFKANPTYWGDKPTVHNLIHEQIADADARVIAALSGKYHVVMDIPLTAYEQFSENEASKIVMVPGAQTQTIYLNTLSEPLSDYRVRQALGWALNRDELILMGMEGLSEPVTTWLGSNPSYEDIKNAFFTKHDLQKAQDLLDDAGWVLGDDGYRYKDEKKLALSLKTFRNDKALGETIQIQWRLLGIDVSVQHGDYSLITTARETGEWDATIEAWGTFGNTSSMLNGQYGIDGAANYGKFVDDMTSNYLQQIESTPLEQDKQIIAKELSLHIAELSPALYICPRPQITAINNNLEGFTPHFRQFENVVNANLKIVE